MKVWDKSYENHPVFVTSIIFVLSVIGFYFRFEDGPAFIYPALGVTFVLVYTFGRSVYLPAGIGVFLAHLVMRIFVLQDRFIPTLFISVATVIVILTLVEVMHYLVKRTQVDRLFDRFEWHLLGKFILINVSIALIGSVIYTIVYLITYQSTFSPWQLGSVRFVAAYFSFIVFVPSGILSYRDDPNVVLFQNLKASFGRILLSVLFIALLVALVLELGYFAFDKDYYIVLAFYVIIGFVFTYRLITYFTLLFLFATAFHMASLSGDAWLASAINLNMFLMIGTGLAITIKRFNDVRYAQRKQIEESNTRNNNILSDVHNLLQFSGDVVKRHEDEDHYLKKTLTVAMNQLMHIDYGYGYIEDTGTIEMIEAIGYKGEVPFVYESHDLLENSENNFFYTQDILDTLRKLYGQQYGLLQSRNDDERRRLLMRFDLGKDRNFIVSIGKSKKRDGFTALQLEHMKQFMKLIRSLFKRNFYLSQNTQMKHEVVLSFIRTLELFDPYTKGHSEDVAHFVLDVAKKLNISKSNFDTLYWAGILHDIGKVGIDNTILNKPAKLTEHEYDQVKNHVQYGHDVLYPSEDLKTLAMIVKHHHEWWNGKGYPDGLKEDQIPLGSQIIGVADMVSTMATDRTYRKRQTKARITEELKKYRGIQFAPRIVDAMVALLDEGLLEKYYPEHYKK